MTRHVCPLLLFLTATTPIHAQSGFTGTWSTTFGSMTLTQKENRIAGFYLFQGIRCTLEGTVEKNRFTFTYKEPTAQGIGWFQLSKDGKTFAGKWKPNGTTEWGTWTGARKSADPPKIRFAGLWKTTYGKMRLIQSGDQIEGIYGSRGASTIRGTVRGNKLTFLYTEPNAKGEGWFTLAEDGRSMTGQWRVQGSSTWSAWTGARMEPTPGIRWLVVLEARWEKDLNQKEFTFGAMLRTFFARSERIRVRHRIFDSASSLQKWSREVAYLAEPVVLVIATHASVKGLSVDGKDIEPGTIAESLHYCANLQLLHFSACEVLNDKPASDLLQALKHSPAFPISGYASSVDWAASAVIEMTYFDLILMRGLTPTAATKQVEKLLPFSGDRKIPGSVLAPAKFRFLNRN